MAMDVVRIEVVTTVPDARAQIRLKRFQNHGFPSVKNVQIKDVYTIDKKFPYKSLTKIAKAISNPVTQKAYILINKNSIKSSADFEDNSPNRLSIKK